ncbi:hypothetical protein ACHAW6_012903 [Cyclotella cf. meneghiniana]
MMLPTTSNGLRTAHILLLLIACLFWSVSYNVRKNGNMTVVMNKGAFDHGDDPVHVLITVCGSRSNMKYYDEAMELLLTIQRYGTGGGGGAVDDEGMRGHGGIIVHLFTDNVKLMKLRIHHGNPTVASLLGRLDIRVYRLREPRGRDTFNLFRKCASARLFAPQIFEAAGYQLAVNATTHAASKALKIPQRIIYLDSDVLVTTSLRKLWDNATISFEEHPDALFAMARENSLSNDNCKETNMCYNSGVLFAHLHRWIQRHFTDMVHEQIDYASKNNVEMPYGDQGILNAMSGRFPKRSLEIGCEWNLRTDTIGKCLDTYRNNGGGILHGNRGLFRKDDAAMMVTSAELLHDYLVWTYDRPVEPRMDWEKSYATILQDMLSTGT